MTDGYTHDPDAFDEDGEYAGPDEDPGDDAEGAAAVHPEEANREFDWRGWTLVAAILLAFVVAPSVIFLYPRVGPMFGLTFYDTYLALPMLPAIVLAVLAVWATTRR